MCKKSQHQFKFLFLKSIHSKTDYLHVWKLIPVIIWENSDSKSCKIQIILNNLLLFMFTPDVRLAKELELGVQALIGWFKITLLIAEQGAECSSWWVDQLITANFGGFWLVDFYGSKQLSSAGSAVLRLRHVTTTSYFDHRSVCLIVAL